MPDLMVDVIISLDGYAAADGWPGFWGMESPEYLAWLEEDGAHDDSSRVDSNCSNTRPRCWTRRPPPGEVLWNRRQGRHAGACEVGIPHAPASSPRQLATVVRAAGLPLSCASTSSSVRPRVSGSRR